MIRNLLIGLGLIALATPAIAGKKAKEESAKPAAEGAAADDAAAGDKAKKGKKGKKGKKADGEKKADEKAAE